MAKAPTVHLDAERAQGAPLTVSLCGYLGVRTVDAAHAEQATCKMCRKLLSWGKRGPLRSSGLEHAATSEEHAEAMHIALRTFADHLQPTAPPPPRLTALEWAQSCKGAPEAFRCGQCPLCEWEREAEKWAAVRPWLEHAEPPTPSPKSFRWLDVQGAIAALQRYEAEGRRMRSAQGAMLSRLALRLGSTMPPAGIKAHAADDLVHVELAIRKAYQGGCAGLDAHDCTRILLERNAGFLETRTPVDELAARYGVASGTVEKVVRHGRLRVAEDLLARGLIASFGKNRPNTARAVRTFGSKDVGTAVRAGRTT